MIGSVHVQGCAFCPKETDKTKAGRVGEKSLRQETNRKVKISSVREGCYAFWALGDFRAAATRKPNETHTFLHIISPR